MKTKDFKLLSTLPEEFEYEILNLNGNNAVFGKKGKEFIAFLIGNEKLTPIKFSVEQKDSHD